MAIEGVLKLQSFLQTVAFCLALAAIQYLFQPDSPYEIALVYSLSIGICIWALIDFGQHLLPTSRGISGLALSIVGIGGGYFFGTLLADQWFGWSSWALQTRSKLTASILITVLAGISATYYFYTRTQSRQLREKMSESQRLATEARLKLLETQLEPHMLFNTLANLRALIGTDPDRAQAMLDLIVGYLRATLSASRKRTHPLQAEFDRLHDYLELMKVRMGPRLTYTLTLPCDLADWPIAPLLLQPLVENAIKHGLEPQIAEGHIAVHAHCDGTTLILRITDTGVGFSPRAADDTPHAGFGLSQVRERLVTHYGPASAMNIEALDTGGTCIKLTLPALP